MSNPMERLAEIKAKTAGHGLTGSVIEPLKGKYYGTRISNPEGSLIEVWGWARKHEPSSRELGEWDDADESFEIYDSHYEDVGDLATAELVVAAPDLLDIATTLAHEVERLRDALDLAAEGEAEMLAENKRLRDVIKWHRREVWGVEHEPTSPYDRELYAALTPQEDTDGPDAL